MQSETVNLIEGAKIVNASTEHLARMARRGDVPGDKIGREWTFLRSDLISVVENRIRAATAARKMIAAATQRKTITGRSRRALPQL